MFSTFVGRKFRDLLIVNLFVAGSEYVLVLAANVIGGHVIGEKALSAITLNLPYISLMAFVSTLVSIGSSALISMHVGAGDREQANRLFGQGLIATVVAAALLSGGLFAWYAAAGGRPGIVDGDAHALMAREFLFWMAWLPLPMMLHGYLCNIFLNEGADRYVTASSLALFVVNIGLSLLLCPRLGIAGLGIASVAGMTAGVIAIAFFWGAKRNKLRVRAWWNWPTLWAVVRFSFLDAGTHLCVFLLATALNVFLFRRFGTDGVVVFSVALNVLLMLIAVFDAVGETIQPLIGIYQAEGSQCGLVKTMAVARRVTVAGGVAITALLLAGAGFIPALFGIADGDNARNATWAVRIMALGTCAVGVKILYASYWLYRGRVYFSAAIAAVQMLVFPLLFGLALGFAFGLTGVWAGVAAALVAALPVSHVLAHRHYPGVDYPLMLDREALARELSYDAPKNAVGITRLVEQVESDLARHAVPREKIVKIAMLIDATEMYAMEAGEERDVVVECTILLGDPITLILRDTGDNDAVMHESAIQAPAEGATDEHPAVCDDSWQAVCGTMLGAHAARQHAEALGQNRSLFRV